MSGVQEDWKRSRVTVYFNSYQTQNELLQHFNTDEVGDTDLQMALMGKILDREGVELIPTQHSGIIHLQCYQTGGGAGPTAACMIFMSGLLSRMNPT